MTEKFWHIREDDLPLNRPELMAATKVRVLKATFCIKGKCVALDSIITLPLHDALSLKAAGKVQLVNEL